MACMAPGAPLRTAAHPMPPRPAPFCLLPACSPRPLLPTSPTQLASTHIPLPRAPPWRWRAWHVRPLMVVATEPRKPSPCAPQPCATKQRSMGARGGGETGGGAGGAGGREGSGGGVGDDGGCGGAKPMIAPCASWIAPLAAPLAPFRASPAAPVAASLALFRASPAAPVAASVSESRTEAPEAGAASSATARNRTASIWPDAVKTPSQRRVGAATFAPGAVLACMS